MDKQTTSAFILMGLILVVWLYFNSPEPQPQIPQPNDTTSVVDKKNSAEADIDENEKVSKPQNLEEQKTGQETEQSQNVFGKTDQEGQIITIETDLSKIEMTNKGGKIRKIYLKEYNTW